MLLCFKRNLEIAWGGVSSLKYDENTRIHTIRIDKVNSYMYPKKKSKEIFGNRSIKKRKKEL